MSTQVQLRGGSTASHATFTGAVREATVDTDKHVLVIHDGSTAGGFPLALEARQILAGAGLTGGGSLAADRTLTVTYGSSASTACEGNDARLSDSRSPSGSAAGDLSGSYPNPGVTKVGGVTVSAFILTLVDDANASTARGTLGLGTLATQNGTFSGTSSGTNTGDQTITLTGDVTGTGTGSFAVTLATAQPAVHTWALAQTFTVAPVFTDASGTRTALGLGTMATQNANAVSISGGSVTGMSSPSGSSDVATKGYVDSLIAGLKWKQSVKAATTANGTLATAFANGQVIDGVTIATGDRLLLKDQTTATENGIYIAAVSGAPTRATDADSGVELVDAVVVVEQGTVNADKAFTCTNDAITIGSTSIVFVNFASMITGALLASNNLSDLASASTARTNLGLGTLATQSGTFSGTSSGTNTGDQTITLTGDVTGTGTGSFATTLTTAQPAVHTWALAQTFTVAPVFTDAAGTRTALGLGTLATQSGTFSGTSSGTNTGDQTITLTGDVTGTGTGSFATTLTTAQPAVHTWALAQTFTVAPVFTDASGTRTALGLGTLATQSGTFSGTSSGTNTGDQTITLTGDVTGTGTGSFATTLATAQPAVHTWALAQTFTVAPVFTDASGTRSALGLGTLATQSGTFSGTSSGTNTGDQTITLTGDVTGTGTGSFAATLANTAVTPATYGDATHVAQITVDAKGRITAASNVLISGGGGGGGITLAQAIAMAVALG